MKKNSKRIFAVLSVALVLAAACAGGWLVHAAKIRSQKAELYGQLARQEKDWIMSQQMENGSFVYKSMEDCDDAQAVIPYFSCIAVRGLLSGTVTQQQAQAAQKYLIWHFEHLNTAQQDPVNGDGTIYDYRVVDHDGEMRLESKNKYDSVDSYAALFLMALDDYSQKVDRDLLTQHASDVVRVVDALLRGLRANKLSVTKSDYPIQYLMDNAEVYAGLAAAENCLKTADPAGERIFQVQQAAQELQQAVEELMWDSEERHYAIGIQDQTVLRFDGWNEFYPDSTAQLFPVCFGLLDPKEARSEHLYEKFCDVWDWEVLGHRRKANDFYWCMLGYAAAVMGDEARLNRYIENYLASLEANGRGYPLYIGDSGWMALSCGYMEEQYRGFFR